MTNADALINYPFCSTPPVRDGSFFGGSPEDRYMECIWRGRTFRLTCTANLIWDTDTGIAPVVMASGGGFYISSGETTNAGVTTVSAFADTDDILCDWRGTFKNAEISTDVASQYGEVLWGPTSDHTGDANSGGVDVPGAGVLDSYLLFTANSGDVFGYLGTEEGATVGGSYQLDTSTGIYLKFKVGGVEYGTRELFKDNDPTYPTNFWTCAGDIVIEAYEWWPWLDSDGNASWNTSTGAQLLDPRRTGALRYWAQP